MSDNLSTLLKSRLTDMRIHHVGYLVRNIERAEKEFVSLGYEVSQETVYDEYRDVDICFLEKDGYVVELVAPKSKSSVVYDLMKKIGNSPYHICYSSSSFDEDVEKLRERNYVTCSEKCSAPALGGRNVCFLVHPFLGMIEIVEE